MLTVRTVSLSVFTSGILFVLPVALAALLLQRYIVRGLTLGAFK